MQSLYTTDERFYKKFQISRNSFK